MQKFSYYNPVKLIYGVGVLAQVGEELKTLAGNNANVLLVYGGGSVKRTGVFDRVMASCQAAGLNVYERGGVRPNPTLEFVRGTIDLIRREKIDVVLALGGGSVIDTAKASILGENYDGDVWDYFCGKTNKPARLPIVAVLTIPAAGSEQSARCVISNGDVKNGAGSESMNVRPKCSIVDPTVFTTLPKRQMAAGVADMMSHIFERYFTNTTAVEFTTGQCEAALKVAMQCAKQLYEDMDDVDAWSQIGLVGSFGHCGYFGMGHLEDWACHAMEHALSGWDPSIVHGEGLAVLTPAWMQYVWRVNPTRFMRFATHVMGVEKQESEEETIQKAIDKLKDFFVSIGLPNRIDDLTDKEATLEEIADLAVIHGPIGHFRVLERDDVLQILRSAT